MKQATTKKKKKKVAIVNPMSKRFREGMMIILVTVALFLFMAMMTYSPADPGWNHSGQNNAINNSGGEVLAPGLPMCFCSFSAILPMCFL